eukprot:CAMPEP_0168380040 /NCGR_PEP_ID=MMETSP0228-20121227/12153_1 /TAXON_ID=133427 /ORGANISM="Protoceratium reticulatum, Strain CCCM 535 (=CCMP 1889)" /LENGTH=1267 /DNA_ID=CAMNT_0008393089 /DNA_START=53 /DNA_END=3853 /DNA_ORIENTATION=-
MGKMSVVSPGGAAGASGTILAPAWRTADVPWIAVDEVEPWKLSELDDVWLQCGWLFLFLAAGLVYLFCMNFCPYSICRMGTPLTPPSQGPAATLHHALYGREIVSNVINALFISLALANFVLFALQTESEFDPETHLFGFPLPVWVPGCEAGVWLVSLVFFSAILVLRTIAAQADPLWCRGSALGSSCLFLLGDPCAHFELAAVAIALLGMAIPVPNMLWLPLARSVQMLSWRPGIMGAFTSVIKVFQDDRPLIIMISAFSTVMWVALSGMYFVANNTNPEMEWEAAVSAKTDENWQRFSSVPSSMFFVLLNLCHEFPLADGHQSFFSRAVAILVCIVAVPLFALPTGLLAHALQREATGHIEATNATNAAAATNAPAGAEEAEAAAEAEVPRPAPEAQGADGWLAGLVTTALAFCSVVVYFYSTAGRTTLLFVTLEVGPGALLCVDGLVSALFGAEWAWRGHAGGCAYFLSLSGLIDLLAWLPGLAHLVAFFLAPAESAVPGWICAACVLRLFKIERFVGAFRDMYEIMAEHEFVLKATAFVAFLLWVVMSTLLYVSEHSNPDEEMRDNYGSVARALWAELVNLFGEWPLTDYTSPGKAICTFIALFSQGVFSLPVAIFSDGYREKVHGQPALHGLHDRPTPWPLLVRPLGPGRRADVWKLLYAHLLPATLRGLDHLLYKVFSVVITLAVPTITAVLTLDSLHAGDDGQDPYPVLSSTLYAADFAIALFMAAELLLHVIALGLPYAWTFHGICSMLSLTGMLVTLTPLRTPAFHPGKDDFSALVDLALPLRILRVFHLEAIVPSCRVLSTVAWLNRGPLAKSGVALGVTWYVYGTLLYLAEHEHGVGPWDGEGEASMANRYSDVLTGLQYSLVHITGDFPVTEYTLAGKVVHFFGIVFGNICIATFTGIFTASFVSYLQSQREQERALARSRRQKAALKCVLVMQRKFRASLRRPSARRSRRSTVRGSVGVAPDAGAGEEPLGEEEPEERLGPLETARRMARQIVGRTTGLGRALMGVANAALVLNVASALVNTVPQVEEHATFRHVCEWIDLLTNGIFVLEYLVYLLAAVNPLRGALQPMRIVDLLCLLPTCAWFVYRASPLTNRGAGNGEGFMTAIEALLLFRIVRVLDFPCIRQQSQTLYRTLMTAVEGLEYPAVLSLEVWLLLACMFLWVENVFQGPEQEHLANLPDALYYMSVFLLGEWANVDFSPGAGSRACILTCLFGVPLFAIPVGLVVEAFQSTIEEMAEEQKQQGALLGNEAKEGS